LRGQVESITHNGEGVARIEGKAVFIPGAIPGETVDIEMIDNRKFFARARLIEVLKPSPDRTEPPCQHYFACGGCSYQHVSYPRQLQLKGQVVQDAIKRIGGIEVKVEPVLGMADPWHYRNKVEWHTGNFGGNLSMGYFRPGSQEIVPIETCLLISKGMEDISRYLREDLANLRVPEGCRITVRQSSYNHEIMLIFSATGARNIDYARLLNHQEVVSIYSLENGKLQLHYGDSVLKERIEDIDFEISPLAFFQVNPAQTRVLVNKILEYGSLQQHCSLLDAYCGTGSIALNASKSVRRVVGVENNRQAIKDAKRNAYANGITHCKFIKGACEEIVPRLDEHFDVVVLDPPRAGCKRELIDAVIKNEPLRIVYVSCNPSTLARDLAIMVKSDYQVNIVQPIDMFPQTSHVEVATLLTRSSMTQ